MCVPSWPRTEDLCAFLSAAFDNARPKPVDIFLPPLRLPPMVVLFVVSLPLDDVQKAMRVSRYARLCSGGNVTSRRRFETSLFSRARRLLLVNTESGALLFDERRTRRERKREREFYITVLDRAHKIDTRSGKERVVLVPSLFGEINRTDRIFTSRRVNAYIHTHIKSSWRQKSSA